MLVVEDEAQVRTIAARALTEAGYRVLEAESGERALDPAAERRPAGPGARRRGDAGHERVGPGRGGRAGGARAPVLFTSGYTDGEILRRGLLEPGAAFLAKPFSPEGLVQAVRGRAAAS